MTARPTDPLRIVFASVHDPENISAFSGTVYYMCQALRTRLPDLETVRFVRPRGYERFRNVVLRMTKGQVNPDYWRWLNRIFARKLARQWHGRRVLVISVVSSSLVSELAELVPVLNITDATFALMRNFYPSFAGYGNRTARAAEEIEWRSVALSIHNSFTTNWAAQSAIGSYGAPPDKVSAISWGSNLPHVPRSEVRLRQKTWRECRLLFIGVDWVRKGGDVVCKVGEILNGRNVPVRVDIAGSSPPGGLPPYSWIHYHGFLSKSDEADRRRLANLMRDADFLFLPTRQDTFGMVFGEANAFGTPALTRAVGGVPEAVRDGVNGIVLPEDALPEDFADQVEALWEDSEHYWRLRESSRREYDERLNWDSWAQEMTGIITQLTADGAV